MFVWRDLDTRSAVRRLRILGVPFAVLFLIPLIFVLYQALLGFSFSFYAGYGLVFELTSSGLKLFGNLVVPVVTGTTLFMALLYILSLPILLIIFTWANVFVGSFKGVEVFENGGKVCEGIKSFIAQGSNREKILIVAHTLALILACLFGPLYFIERFGILVTPYLSIFLMLFLISFIGFAYSGIKIEQALKNYAETVQT